MHGEEAFVAKLQNHQGAKNAFATVDSFATLGVPMRNSTVKLTPMQASSRSSMLKACGLAEAARRACTTRSSMPRRRASSEPIDDPSAEKPHEIHCHWEHSCRSQIWSSQSKEGSHFRSQWIPALQFLAAQDMPMAGSQVP